MRKEPCRAFASWGLASCLVALAACGRAETPPPVPQAPEPAPLGADTHPVAFEPLAAHHPRIVSHAEGGALSRMTLWAIGTDGLRERVFDADTDAWSGWVVRGIPAGITHPPSIWEDFGADLFADSGFASDRPAVVAVYSHQGNVLTPDRLMSLPTDRPPYGTPANYKFNEWDSRDWMRPMALIPDGDGTGIRVYGTWFDDGLHDPRTELLEAAFVVEASGHVRPRQGEPVVLPRFVAPVGGTDTHMLVEPGPNSALLVPRTLAGATVNQRFVFVKREPKGMPGNDGLAVWHDDGQGGTGWVDLGTPVTPPSKIVGPPLAVSWINTATGRYTVNVFVVARREEGDTRWELYERYWVDDDSSPAPEGWRPWSNHGSPRWDPYDADKGQLLEPGTRWRLTAGLTWQLDGVVRMNLFGNANPETDRDGVSQPRRLVEYVWDGANWNWGFHHDPPPSGRGVKTISAAWVNKDGAIRLSLACRDDAGGVLERYYLIDSAGWRGWFWNDLTD